MPHWKSNANVALIACALLLLAVACYHPGLHGAFLFDDFGNLPSLGATGPVDNWPTFWRYITSGIADPTGRPIALLSFLIDARDWPADPWPFKRTNLVLHLLNGALLWLLLRRLGRLSHTDGPATQRTDIAALIGAAFWLLHPLFVSTTLYIVQREAMLPTLFTLVGLLMWLRGHTLLLHARALRGAAWMVAGLGGCTVLAVFSKANGVLLPALALVLDYTLLRSPAIGLPATPNIHRRLMWLLAVLPSLVIAGYLVWAGWQGMVYGISAIRPWTLGQRLLTEPRVLMDYLSLLWLPRPFTAGLFNDQFHASTSLFSPITTLPSLLVLATLTAAAFALRKRHPAWALAALFYLVGQSMESSTVALELYFEHRNYLPALLMFWPLALWLCDASLSPQATPPTSWNKPKTALTCALVLGLATLTWAGADLWGNSHDQALLWAQMNPDSPRAQASAAMADMAAGRADLAVIRLKPALAKSPDEVQIAMNLLGAECQLGHIEPSSLEAANNALAITRDPGALIASWFNRAIDQAAHPTCPELSLSALQTLLHAAQGNPHLESQPGRLQDLDYLEGRIALARGNGDAALTDFNRSLDQQVRISAALQYAALLGSAGFPAQGLAHLDHYQSVRSQEYSPGSDMPAVQQWVYRREHYWDNELARLRATLRSDATAKTRQTP